MVLGYSIKKTQHEVNVDKKCFSLKIILPVSLCWRLAKKKPGAAARGGIKRNHVCILIVLRQTVLLRFLCMCAHMHTCTHTCASHSQSVTLTITAGDVGGVLVAVARGEDVNTMGAGPNKHGWRVLRGVSIVLKQS